MKNIELISSLFFLATPILFSPVLAPASASILSPTDIVLYNEKDPQNNLIGIKKLQDGTEWITQAACDKDVWIGTLADETAHCHAAIPILRVSDFAKTVENTVAKVASENPGTPLAPLPPADIVTYAESLRTQADPANTTAIQQLMSAKAELKSVNDMLVHLPDNPDYLDRKKTAETEIAKLAKIDQQISNAQNQQAKIDSELVQLSESMLNLIRYKKLKNPQMPFSAMNPETEEPNSLGKSQMQGTLLKAVLEHLTDNNSATVNYHNQEFKLSNGTMTYNGSSFGLCSDCTYPYLFTDGKYVYAFMTYHGAQIYEAVYKGTNLSVNAGIVAHGFITEDTEGFSQIINIVSEGNGIRVTALTTDGRMWQKSFTIDELINPTSGNWTEIK